MDLLRHLISLSFIRVQHETAWNPAVGRTKPTTWVICLQSHCWVLTWNKLLFKIKTNMQLNWIVHVQLGREQNAKRRHLVDKADIRVQTLSMKCNIIFSPNIAAYWIKNTVPAEKVFIIWNGQGKSANKC